MQINRIEKNNRPIYDISSAIAVRCPVCHKGRLMDVAEGTDISQMQLSGSEQFARCQCYIKCPKCGRRIGVKFGKVGNRVRRLPLLH